MNNYNHEFEDTMDNINNIAYGYGFKNGIEWASYAQKRGEISWEQYKRYENAHNLRVRYSHGNARDIQISSETYYIVKEYERNISRSRLRRQRIQQAHTQIRLPAGTFRSYPYYKSLDLSGQDGRSYHFRFGIVEEYQKRAYDDGTRFEGTGYTIYVLDAPYESWCLQNNRIHEFHFYDEHSSEPSICWNRLITSFSDANAIMLIWAKRYVKILDRVLSSRSIDMSRIDQCANRHILPSGTFRYDPSQSHEPKTIYIKQSVYDKIMSILGKRKPELGGMLGWKDDQRYIDYFVLDTNARVGQCEYNPDTKLLSSILNGDWYEKRIYLGGFVHSHPFGSRRLSSADVAYAVRIMKEFELEYLFMPIVTSSYRDTSSFNPYIVYKDGFVRRCKIKLTKEEIEINDQLDLYKSIEDEFEKMSGVHAVSEDKCNKTNETFSRISNVLDIGYFKECSIIGVGCGGAKGFYEDMARIGVANFYLMDGDTISTTNIASQHGYISEIGEFKVECAKKQILDINSEANVVTFDCMLDDSLDDKYIEDSIISKVDKSKTVLCAFTDNFYAQARLSRIALKYGLPFICAQHHARGEVSEIVYYYPNVTKYSLKEIAKSRYQDYKNGFVNNVTSQGSPIFNTTRLNALCEKIATGLLLYAGYKNHTYCSFLNEKTESNLILVRQNILFEMNPLYDLFANQTSSLFDDAIWVNPNLIENIEDSDAEKDYEDDTRKIF